MRVRGMNRRGRNAQDFVNLRCHRHTLFGIQPGSPGDSATARCQDAGEVLRQRRTATGAGVEGLGERPDAIDDHHRCASRRTDPPRGLARLLASRVQVDSGAARSQASKPSPSWLPWRVGMRDGLGGRFTLRPPPFLGLFVGCLRARRLAGPVPSPAGHRGASRRPPPAPIPDDKKPRRAFLPGGAF